MSGYLLNWVGPGPVPAEPPADMAVAENFERFDGLTPLDHPGGQPPLQGSPNRPGFLPTPDVYTPGPVAGVVGAIGATPLPVSDRIHRPEGTSTAVVSPSTQFRFGVGQHGPASLGLAQTLDLAGLVNNPPQPGSMEAILAGLA